MRPALKQSDSPIAQLVERWTVNPCVVGSSPTWGAKSPLLSRNQDSPIAQLVERWTVNPCVVGSSPTWGANLDDNRSIPYMIPQ